MGTQTSPNVKASPKVRAALAMLAIVAGGAFLPAHAETTPSSQQVSYADLDISAPAGARILLSRIEAASEKACAGQLANSPLLPRERSLQRACVADAVSQTVAKINSPVLAQLHKGEADAVRLATR